MPKTKTLKLFSILESAPKEHHLSWIFPAAI
jgi:hypothetical protein